MSRYTADLRRVLGSGADEDGLDDAIRATIALKPQGDDFIISCDAKPAVARHMSLTGGLRPTVIEM